MIASALFIDGKLDRWFANPVGQNKCFQVLSMLDGEAVASRKGSNFRPVWARNGIFRAPISSRITPNPNSLIGRIISLITCSNSLQASKDFPVRIRRELPVNPLIQIGILGHLGHR